MGLRSIHLLTCDVPGCTTKAKELPSRVLTSINIPRGWSFGEKWSRGSWSGEWDKVSAILCPQHRGYKFEKPDGCSARTRGTCDE